MLMPPDSSGGVAEALYPKAVANYISKLPEFQGIEYPLIVGTMQESQYVLEERCKKLGLLIGKTSLTDEVASELSALYLAITDREELITDASKCESYATSDANQLRDRVSDRNLAYFMDHGLTLEFEAEAGKSAARAAAEDEREVPLFEKLKAERLFKLNGFGNSRVLHLVHDVLDHPLLFYNLKNEGLFDEYSDFFSSIDLIDETFLYSRQAELIASVGFGSRRYNLAIKNSEEIVLSDENIEQILTSGDERTEEALIRYKAQDEHGRERVRFVIENMAIQIADERRRYGSVKQRKSGAEYGPMALLDPIYVAFLVEAAAIVAENDDYKNAQVKIGCVIEKILEELVSGSATDGDSITIAIPSDSMEIEPDIEPDKVTWIINNLDSSVSYNRINEKGAA